MAARKKKQKQLDLGKDRKLAEFLKNLDIETEKRDRIVAFVEELTFRRLKELSTGISAKREEEEKWPKLRLRMPWQK